MPDREPVGTTVWKRELAPGQIPVVSAAVTGELAIQTRTVGSATTQLLESDGSERWTVEGLASELSKLA